METRVQARIDLAALQHNLQRARALAPASKIMAVVKANAYGHGLRGCLPVLSQADALAVATLEEAGKLRGAGFAGRVLLLEGVGTATELQQAHQWSLDLVIHQPYQLELLAQQGLDFALWLKVDTGMHRLGFPMDQLNSVMERLRLLPVPPREVVLMSHFCCADQPGDGKTRQQIEHFARLARSWSGACSLANSAGILQWPESHYDWVRAGAMLYGISPVAGKTAAELGLQPAMRFQAQVLAVNPVKAGEQVGYGARWQSPRDTRIAIVSAGYGDGYPRHAADGTPVAIDGRCYSLAGRVSMDMLAVDVGPNSPVQPGMPVELWGRAVAVDTVAGYADTIGYELVLRLTSRVHVIHEGLENEQLLQHASR